MPVDFDSLLARQTVADIKTSFIAACNFVGFAVSSLPPLARLRKLALDVVPVMFETSAGVHAEAIRGGLLDYAAGAWLELLAINLSGLDGRIGQTFATVAVTFTNAGANAYNFAAGEVRVSNGITVYKTLEAFALAPSGNDGDEVTVDVIATVAGTAGNADAGDITTMVTTFDDVTCENAAAARATDEETDEALRARCRLARAAISNSGPAAAIELLALSAVREDGTAIGITRVQILEHSPTIGDVKVFLADADGAPAGDDVTEIDDQLRERVIPTGVNYLGTFPVSTVTVNVVATAYSRTDNDFTTAELEDAAEAAVDALFASYKVGGEVVSGPNGLLFKDDIRNAISDAQPPGDGTESEIEEGAPGLLRSVAVTTPAGDTTLTPGQIPVLTSFAITITRY